MNIPFFKGVADCCSVGVGGASLFGIMPRDGLSLVASGLTVVWMLIRIYETATVQKFLRRHKGEEV